VARQRFYEIVEQEPFAVMFDTHVPGMWGGSGVVGDWELAREFARAHPVFLAGGLDFGNVGAAIEEVDPFAVDVSSGVETNKVKDHDKIRTFILAARNGRQADE
jgi:phosphoribosylanthranilate isomerase